MGNCFKPEYQMEGYLQRTYLNSFKVFDGTRENLYTDFGLCLTEDVFEHFINIRVQEANENNIIVKFESFQKYIDCSLEDMQRNGKTWKGKMTEE